MIINTLIYAHGPLKNTVWSLKGRRVCLIGSLEIQQQRQHYDSGYSEDSLHSQPCRLLLAYSAFPFCLFFPPHKLILHHDCFVGIRTAGEVFLLNTKFFIHLKYLPLFLSKILLKFYLIIHLKNGQIKYRKQKPSATF